MTSGELFRMYFERSEALQAYWTLYVIVIGGLLAFSNLRKRRALLVAMLVSILYICFAYKNLGAIHDAIDQQAAIREAAMDVAQAGVEARLLGTLTPSAQGSVRNFHVSCDLLTLAAIWTMEWRRRENAERL